jgi:hypothetical protein
MSVFTERDFDMLAQGYLLKDILKDHVENYDEVYKFYLAFYKDRSDSVDNRRTFLKEINRVHDSYAINPNEFWLFAGDNVRIKIFIKKSIFNLPKEALIKDTSPMVPPDKGHYTYGRYYNWLYLEFTAKISQKYPWL